MRSICPRLGPVHAEVALGNRDVPLLVRGSERPRACVLRSSRTNGIGIVTASGATVVQSHAAGFFLAVSEEERSRLLLNPRLPPDRPLHPRSLHPHPHPL